MLKKTLEVFIFHCILLFHYNSVYEKIEEKLRGIGANNKGLKKKIGDWAKGVALQGNTNKERGYVQVRIKI